MSRSHHMQLHIVQLQEIRTILNSMKNMAIMEIHKLGRFQDSQSQAVAHIEQTALDFLAFYPELMDMAAPIKRMALLIGSERGFCGDFNEALIQKVASQAFTGVILIGERLSSRWPAEQAVAPLIAALAGANVVEEIPAILQGLIDILSQWHNKSEAMAFTVIYHEANKIVQKQVLPPFIDIDVVKPTPLVKIPPILNLHPSQFMAELVDHYLLAMLHEIFYRSLLAENHQRLQHLDAAVRHLDEETVTLQRKAQIYRQEEITEEIEVILLNTEG